MKALLSLKTPAQRRRWQRDTTIAAALRREGATIRLVAAALGVSEGTVQRAKSKVFGNNGPAPLPAVAG